MVGLFGFSVVGFLSCLCFPQVLARFTQKFRTIILIVATFFFVLSQLYIGYSSELAFTSSLLMGANGLIASAGILGLGVLWFLAFRIDSTDHILRNTATSLVVAATVAFAFFFIPSLLVQALCASVLTALSSLLLYRAQKTSKGHARSENLPVNIVNSDSSPSHQS